MKATASLLAVCVLVLTGCASMSKNECRAVDWRTVGYEDGVAGYSGDRIAQHRKACAKHGVAPDLDAYRAGREQGLSEFCQPHNGFLFGSRGGTYQGVCPAELAPGFVDAYETGRELYVLERRVNNAHAQIAAKRRELEHLEHRMADLGMLVISDKTTSEDRAQALIEVKQLAERYGRLEAEIRELESDRIRYEHELEDYRTQLAYAG